MKILWVGNVVLPVIADDMKIGKSVGGGWMVKLSQMLANNKNNEFTYIFPTKDIKQVGKTGVVNGIRYIAFPEIKYNEKREFLDLIARFSIILQEVKPEVVHIFGTEYVHSLAMMKANQKEKNLSNTVISIQGLVSEYAKSYFADLPLHVTLGMMPKEIKCGNLRKRKKVFQEKGVSEIKALKLANHVIGRTDWDRAVCWTINPDSKYHFNNEILRDSFYENQWDIEKCCRRTIFFSQAHYPIKGLHFMLEALSELTEHYPDIKLRIGGRNYSKLLIYRLSYYEVYIKKLIKKWNLEDHVEFTGYLQEAEMCKEYINANAFVSSSAIENSPNSVGEAMLLGVPTISSDVGGVKNMLEHSKEGFVYPANSPKMLAYYIKKLFEDDSLAVKFSNNSKEHARNTHNVAINYKELLDIYHDIHGGR